jgi:hypothetical protein
MDDVQVVGKMADELRTQMQTIESVGDESIWNSDLTTEKMLY